MPNLDKLTIILPQTTKPNGKSFTHQKGDFCVPYSFLRILLFHEQHPKHYSNKEYPKNFKLAITAFKKAQAEWFKCKPEEKPLYNYKPHIPVKVSETDNELEHSEDLEDLCRSEVSDPIYIYNWKQADFQRSEPPAFPEEDGYFAYLFGCQALPFANIEHLTTEQIKMGLEKYGPLVLGGAIGFELSKVINIGFIKTSDGKLQYKLASVPQNAYPAGEHSVVLIGVELVEPVQVYYIDPNEQQQILRVALNKFLPHLSGTIYYYPCKQDAKNIGNKVASKESANDVNQKLEHPQLENITCDHIQHNLKLPKTIEWNRFSFLGKKASQTNHVIEDFSNSLHNPEKKQKTSYK